MAVLLARHCASAADLSEPTTLDFPDSPLSAPGWRRATRLAGLLCDFDIRTIVTSDRRRAQQSVEEWARVQGAEVIVSERLREWSRPGLRGLPEDLARQIVSEAIRNPDKGLPGGGETFGEQCRRILPLVFGLLALPGLTGVCMHSTGVKLVASVILNVNYEDAPLLEPGQVALVTMNDFHILER
jgi:broad specificity phosphatase PhoE